MNFYQNNQLVIGNYELKIKITWEDSSVDFYQQVILPLACDSAVLTVKGSLSIHQVIFKLALEFLPVL
jgi:hypothetical protein